EEFEGIHYSRLNKPGAFSFFRWIFLEDQNPGSAQFKIILKHEQAHARQLHSLDIVLAELFKCIFWWNPFNWKVIAQIKLNHEFIVDRTCYLEYGKKDYTQLIVARFFGVPAQSIVNSINHVNL